MKYSLTALVFVAATLPTSPAHAACAVTVSFPNFSPATYTVQAGGTVTWCWAESGHSVEGSFGDSGVRTADAEYPITFSTPGTYAYQCGVHGSMQASIVVQGTQPSSTPSKTTSPTPKPTTKSPTPTPLRTTPAAALTTPPTRFPTPTPTTAAPTTTPPATATTPPATTSAPTTPSTTPAAVEIDPAPAKPKTGLAIALGLLVAVGAIGGAAWLLLRGRTG